MTYLIQQATRQPTRAGKTATSGSAIIFLNGTSHRSCNETTIDFGTSYWKPDVNVVHTDGAA